jgi:hypothetical protein
MAVVPVTKQKFSYKLLALFGLVTIASMSFLVYFSREAELFSSIRLEASSSFFWDPTVAAKDVDIPDTDADVDTIAAPQTKVVHVDCAPSLHNWNTSTSTSTSTTNHSTWRTSKRHHNIDDGGSIVTKNAGDSDYLTQVLTQALCHEDSAFGNPPPQRKQTNSSDQQQQYQQVELELEEEHHWMYRLAYLGYHLHQHEPAFPEMEERRRNQERLRQCPTDSFTRDEFHHRQSANNSSSENKRHEYEYEYECPNTKYLVSNVHTVGMGAAFRMGAVSTFLAGIALNRTVVFINAGSKNLTNAKFLSTRWPTSGCRDRGDYQCYFLPLSPCVPSIQDLQQATVLSFDTKGKDHTQSVQINGAFRDKNLDRKKVVIMPGGTYLEKLTDDGQLQVGKRLQELIQQQIDNHKLKVPKWLLERLGNVAPLDFKPSGDQQGVKYNHGRSILRPAALLYLLRPNAKFKRNLDAVVKKASPPDFASEHSFGMPIRASDKCRAESTCLLFEEYMELVSQQHHKYHGSNNDTSSGSSIISDIVLSSESSNIMATRHQWQKNHSSFRFVVNDDDIQQGSGAPKSYGKGAYDVMLSSIAVLKLQLLSKHLVANCCSSFHQMLMDIVKTGCGVPKSPTFHCMQELQDPKFQLCCQWTKGGFCKTQMVNYKKRVQEIGVQGFL